MFINLILRSTDNIPTFTTLATIPNGYRPLSIIYRHIASLRNGANGKIVPCYVTIDTSGRISVEYYDVQDGIYNELYIDVMYIIN